MKLIRSRKGMEWEEIIRWVVALSLLVVIILLIMLFSRGEGGLMDIGKRIGDLFRFGG